MLMRRSVTLPLAVVGFPVLVLLAPVLLPAALLVDLVTAPRRFATTRLYLAVAGYAAWTMLTQVRILDAWVRSGFGLRNWHPAGQKRLRLLTRWWVNGLVTWFRPVLGYRVEVEGLELLHEGPLLVFARHESIFDALLPPALVTRASHMSIRVVLMRELRFEPSLDLVGHRASHHFVERVGPNQPAETEAVGRLASSLPQDTAVVIFPEGRLYRPEVRERVIERLETSDRAAAERARSLRNLLPPRPGGALALLDNAPAGTDVAFVAHVGFSQLTDARTVWRSIPLRRPIDVLVVRCPAEEIPEGRQQRILWMHEQWTRLDVWIGERLADRTDRAD
jgi:1-acyl-sn-glycerol-3-phosphate acyltransferase